MKVELSQLKMYDVKLHWIQSVEMNNVIYLYDKWHVAFFFVIHSNHMDKKFTLLVYKNYKGCLNYTNWKWSCKMTECKLQQSIIYPISFHLFHRLFYHFSCRLVDVAHFKKLWKRGNKQTHKLSLVNKAITTSQIVVLIIEVVAYLTSEDNHG